MIGMVSPEERVAQFASQCTSASLDLTDLHHLKRALLDWHGAVISGSTGSPASILEESLSEELDRGSARLVSGRKAAPRAAAMINGAASHTMEVDDIFRNAIYHPGSPIISAALSIAQSRALSGDAFIRGVLAGYEVSTRIGAAIAVAHCKYWHATGTVGCIGAATASAVTLGLSAEQIRHAISLATTFAAGLQQAFRHKSLMKPFHSGHAADVGVMAAFAAANGLYGAEGMLSGEAGFGRAMGGNPDWDSALSTLGKTSNIQQISFKIHFCCGHIFPAVDATLALRDQILPHLDEIESIKAYTYSVAKEVVGSNRVSNASEACFSMPYMIAYALRYGAIGLDAVNDRALADPNIRSLMQTVTIIESDEMNALFPRHRSCRLVITLKNGESMAHYQKDRVGDPELPVSDEQLTEKYRHLSEPVIGANRSNALLELIWKIEDLSAEELQRLPGCV